MKKCFISICRKLLLSLKEPYDETIGDLITCICRQKSYKILEEIFSLHPKILKEFDSQFQEVVVSSFNELKSALGFLRAYLSFSGSSAIPLFSGLMQAEVKNEYFALATKVCLVAKETDYVFEPDFLSFLLENFSKVVIEKMKIYQQKDNFKQLNSFRDSYQSFYPELLPCFVWLQFQTSPIIPQEIIISFCIVEINSSNEKWIKQASINALILSLNSKISSNIFHLIFQVLLQQNLSKDQLFQLTSFTFPNEIHEWILEYVLRCEFWPKVVANLLMKLPLGGIQISNVFLSQLNSLSFEVQVSFISILFRKIPLLIYHTLDKLLLTDCTNQIKNEAIKLAVILKAEIPVNPVVKFCISTFKKGGMALAGFIVSNNVKVGPRILSKLAKAAIILIQNDQKNSLSYLYFLKVGLSFKSLSYLSFYTRVCLFLLERFQVDHDKPLALSVVECLQNVYNDSLKDVVQPKLNEIVFVLESLRISREQEESVSKLKTFSIHVKDRHEEEWEDVEIET